MSISGTNAPCFCPLVFLGLVQVDTCTAGDREIIPASNERIEPTPGATLKSCKTKCSPDPRAVTYSESNKRPLVTPCFRGSFLPW
ncbi:hypothetical protein GGR57DRAFT_423327 [Xylariaceae sp. FL1272]|nr:hypothetical protein GGR57DRAFT_423327 [Xylariaceae sp. FL1272]